MRITNGMLRAAEENLETIWDLATEQGNPDGNCLRYHSVSASNSLTLLRQKGRPLPAFAIRNIRFLQTMQWRFDL